MFTDETVRAIFFGDNVYTIDSSTSLTRSHKKCQQNTTKVRGKTLDVQYKAYQHPIPTVDISSKWTKETSDIFKKKNYYSRGN